MSNRSAVPIFSTSVVDNEFSKALKSGSITPKNNHKNAVLPTESTPLSSKASWNKENFRVPVTLNSSRQRWKSASALSDSNKAKHYDKRDGQHNCSPSLSPKSSRTVMNRFCSDNHLNDSMALDLSITTPSSPWGETSNFVVGVRVRPFNTREEKDQSVRNVVTMTENLVSLTCGSGTVHSFSYDHCFSSFDKKHQPFADQATVFNTMVEPLLDQLLCGYNACLLAYGQTGSGKSYSMMGVYGSEGELNSEAGVIPRFCAALFERASQAQHEICVEISFYEIYNEKIHDLLASHTEGRPALRVREHPTMGPHVVDLAVHSVTSFNDVRGWLTVGNSHRITAATGVNEKSSRSHSIFSVLVTQKREGVTCRSRANLVDLAGSERVAQTALSTSQLKEGVSINKSLLSLGKVITFLSERGRRRTTANSFGPYRESVLTWLLRESLGGNSKTAMLATISPANVHLDETLATLRYACQARSIVNRVHRNEDPNERIIRELRVELDRVAALRVELDEMKKINEMSSQKQEEIDRLKLQLKEAEAKLNQDHRPWEEKVQTASERKLAELEYLRDCGVAVGSTIDNSSPCLVTLSPDPILSGTLLYLLPPGRVTVGRADTSHIVLHSPLVSQLHCSIENKEGQLWLIPVEGAETFVNGIAVTQNTQLMHGDRLVIGGVHFFRVRTCRESENSTNVCADFEQAQRELRREQEARLRSEVRAELDATHAQELNGVLTLLNEQSSVLRQERQTEADRAFNNEDIATSLVSPYRSTFLQELRTIFAKTQRTENMSLLDTHLLVREANQRCQDYQLDVEFFHELLEGDFILEPSVTIWDKNRDLTCSWRPEELLSFLTTIRECDCKETMLDTLKSLSGNWEKSREIARPCRRISVRKRGSSKLSEEPADYVKEMQRQAQLLSKIAIEDATIRTQLKNAMPHFQAFVAALNVSECPTKTVRFAATT